MNVRENVPLAPHTTFHIGGPARFFIEAGSEQDIVEAISFAKEQHLPLVVLGAGSNVLVPDGGVEGVVVKMSLRELSTEENAESVEIRAETGARWDDVVDVAGALGAFGIENLAGIPGSLGGAVVQNIGAYGAELSATFAYADTVDMYTGEKTRVIRDEASFDYRTSFFKQHPEYIITCVALRCVKNIAPNISYPDLVRVQADGVPLTTPREIASAVRAIRARKFPQDSQVGMAGSFFKNPLISEDQAKELVSRFPGLPTFPQANGRVKVPLAWLLDHALMLKGYSIGPVRLYEGQPLVVVAKPGARAEEVDVFANKIAEKVFVATGIHVEREVEMFCVK